MYEESKDPAVSENVEVWDAFWDKYAGAFAQPIQANGSLSNFVTNPNVTGAYAEAWVRSMAQNMLGRRFRISTGAVIRPSDAARDLSGVPQCDLIVWDPSEMPAIFESADFAVVPHFAARAIIEIKRIYKKEAVQQLAKLRDLLPTRRECILGVVVSHNRPLFNEEYCRPDWLEDRKAKPNVEPAMTRLLDKDGRPDTKGIMAFIYFLAQLAGHNRVAARPSLPKHDD